MTAPAPAAVDWPAARQAVAEAGSRVTALLRSARRPDAPALGEWDFSELALHVSHAVDTVTAMTKGGGNLIEDISGLSTLTKVMVAGEGRRSLAEVADRIDASIAGFLSGMEAAGDDGICSWMVEGTELPLSSLTCHVLSELTVHGLDLARAEGVPWPIDRTHATLILQGFMFPALSNLGGSMVVPSAAGVRARFEVRLRGDGRVWFNFSDGDLAVEASPQGAVDCHLSVDPAAFLLVAWSRTSQWSAIGRGQLLAWGRKPWLGVRMRSWVRDL